jgi:hypothetical protein
LATKPGPISEPKPKPVETKPELTSLQISAKAYVDSFPAALAEVASQIRGGKLTSKDQVVVAMTEAHNPKRVAWTSALDMAFAAVTDNTGKITDQEGAAKALESASAAMK